MIISFSILLNPFEVMYRIIEVKMNIFLRFEGTLYLIKRIPTFKLSYNKQYEINIYCHHSGWVDLYKLL